MSTFVLVTTLLAITSAVWSAQIPCTGDSCTDLNVFLGPKWGSKTLRIPNNLNIGRQSEGEVAAAVKDVPESPLAADEVDDIVAKPTDKPDDETDDEDTSEADYASEPHERGDMDDSEDWGDDLSGEFIHKTPEPTAISLEKILENNGKIIDWAVDSSTKVSAEAIEPTGKPTDWIAQTERTDSRDPLTNDVSDFQDATQRYDGRTADRGRRTSQRPKIADGGFEIDYSNDYKTDFGFDNDGSTKVLPKTWISIDNLNVLFDEGTLNLTGLGLSGEQVKQTLAGLSVDVRTQLRRLFLSNNQLRSLPALTFPVELEYGLVELRLDNNPLNVLDSYTRFELSRLGNLKALSLARTGVQYFDSLYIPSLETLDLSGNQLSTLPWRLDGFRALRHLNLSSNRISMLSTPSPTTYESVRVLDLSHNGLQFIWNLPFENMLSLDVLYLNNNRLQYWIQIKDIPARVTVFLAGNAWECSCPLVRSLCEHQSWPYIADKEALRCTDQNIRVPWPVSSLREQDVTIDCPRRWDWLRLPYQRVVRWFDSHGWHMNSLVTLLWWAVLLGGLVAVWRAVRRYHNTTAPTPYTILDDKQVI